MSDDHDDDDQNMIIDSDDHHHNHKHDDNHDDNYVRVSCSMIVINHDRQIMMMIKILMINDVQDHQGWRILCGNSFYLSY